ncbi:MAG: PKD domain-containing protein, partial [Mycobacteriales bacterium]
IPLNLSTLTPGSPIPAPGGPGPIAIAPSGKMAFVYGYNSNGKGNGEVFQIDLAANTVTKTFSLAGSVFDLGPQGITVGPAGKTVYATEFGANDVATISKGKVGAPITGFKVEPIGIAITPDQPPVAAFSSSAAIHGHASTFNASSSYPQTSPIARYAWTWGDGATTTTTNPTTTHTYAKAGTYTVTLTVTDIAGTSTTCIFTGQTVSNNGGPIARISHSIVIG